MSIGRDEELTEEDEKRVALRALNEAWAQAKLDGVSTDCLAQACLFAALAQFVQLYGVEATAEFAKTLPVRIQQGDFTVEHKT